MSKISNKLSMHIGSEISLKEFSFSQLIVEVNLVLNRLLCLNCRKTFSPMTKLFDLNQYSRKSREFEKILLETITDQSFRRSAKSINEMMEFYTSHTTLHRWFWNKDSINIDQKMKVEYLIADGTGFEKDKDSKKIKSR